MRRWPMMLCALAAGAASLSGAVTRSAASVVWSGWVNGFGSSEITYTLIGRNGQVIQRTTNNSSGSDSTADGSNSISWNYGAFWHKDTRGNNQKNVQAATSAVNTTAALAAGGTQFLLTGTNTGDANFGSELAVLTVAGSQLPTDLVPRSVEQLISEGFITTSNVAFMRSYTGPWSDSYNAQLVDLRSEHNEENVVLYQYALSVPTPSAAGAVVMGGMILIRRRRR